MSVASIVGGLLQFYSLLIFVYVIMSWVRPSGAIAEVYHVLGTVCEPYIGIFRRIVPVAGGLDFSPMVALLVLQFGGSFIVRLLYNLGL